MSWWILFLVMFPMDIPDPENLAVQIFTVLWLNNTSCNKSMAKQYIQ